MVRRFNYGHHRLLLYLQVEITEVEKALFELDKKDETNPDMDYRRFSTKHKENEDAKLVEVMGKLKVKLKEYGEPPAQSLVQPRVSGTDTWGRRACQEYRLHEISTLASRTQLPFLLQLGLEEKATARGVR